MSYKTIKNGVKLNGEVIEIERKVRSKFKNFIFRIKFIGLDGKSKITQIESKNLFLLQMNESVPVFVDPKNSKFAVVKIGRFNNINIVSILKKLAGLILVVLFASQFYFASIEDGKFWAKFSVSDLVLFFGLFAVSFFISLKLTAIEDSGNIESAEEQEIVELENDHKKLEAQKKYEEALPIFREKLSSMLRKAQLILGVGLIVIAFFIGKNEFYLLTQGKLMTGKVVSYEPSGQKSIKKIGGINFSFKHTAKTNGQLSYTPIVEIQVGEQLYQFKDSVGSSSNFTGNFQVQVIYDPKDPFNAIVKRPINNWIPWAPMFILGLFLLLKLWTTPLKAK